MKTRSDDLELLLAVVDCGGFSAAAENLNIQVARISRAVSRVESQLNCTILNRTTRRIELTDEGRQFIDSIRIGLESIQHAEEMLIQDAEHPKGRLRVDAVSPFVLHQLIPLIKEFKESYPEIELELTSNEGIVDLLEKRTDVAIRIGKLTDSSLYARPLGKSPLYIVASPEYLSLNGTPQKATELSQHQLIGFKGPKILNQWPIVGLDTINPELTASSGEVVRQLTLTGNGIACLSSFMVSQDIASGKLTRLLTTEISTEHNERESVNAVFYKSSTLAKRITAFIDFIQPRLTL